MKWPPTNGRPLYLIYHTVAKRPPSIDDAVLVHLGQISEVREINLSDISLDYTFAFKDNSWTLRSRKGEVVLSHKAKVVYWPLYFDLVNLGLSKPDFDSEFSRREASAVIKFFEQWVEEHCDTFVAPSSARRSVNKPVFYMLCEKHGLLHAGHALTNALSSFERNERFDVVLKRVSECPLVAPNFEAPIIRASRETVLADADDGPVLLEQVLTGSERRAYVSPTRAVFFEAAKNMGAPTAELDVSPPPGASFLGKPDTYFKCEPSLLEYQNVCAARDIFAARFAVFDYFIAHNSIWFLDASLNGTWSWMQQECREAVDHLVVESIADWLYTDQ